MRALLLCLAVTAGIAPGEYKGKWQGGQSDGQIRITLTDAEAGKLNATVSFTLNGEDVKCQVTSVKTDGPKLTIVYTFDLMDYKLESTLEGEQKGATLAGNYSTKVLASGDPVDQGSWSASPTK